MRRLRRILKSTAAKAMGLMFIACFASSILIFPDFYKRKISEVQGYYYVYQGDKAYKNKDLQNAIFFYEKGIKYHKRHYRAMYNLANIYVAYEDYYSALKNYEKALKVNPDYDVARIDYAIILTETHETDKAIQEYKKVIKKTPTRFYKIPFIIDKKKTYFYNKGVAYYNMGLAYRIKSLLAGLDDMTRQKYLNEAAESYEKAVEYLKNYNSNYNLGLIQQLVKNKNQAGYFYCKAMEINPLEYEAHFNYAILLNELKEYAAAAEEFKKAGLLLDSNGDNIKTKYIYDILSEVNTRIAINNDKEYYKELQENEEKVLNLKYQAGKIIFDEQTDENMIENFKTCTKKELFMGDE